MKAAILTHLNAPLEIKEVELTPLCAGQVLIRVAVSGLCGAQLQEIKGHKGNAKFLPHLLGHEGCGIVEEVGVGVSRVAVGDKVVMHWKKGEGIESHFPTYILNGKKISGGKVTTLSEYSIASENRLTVVPADTSEYLSALLGCGMTTALGAINNDAELKFGESILILGCGGIGLNLIQGAILGRAHPVTCVDIKEKKKHNALAVGASKFVTRIDDLDDSEKFDVIIDTTGNHELISKSFSFLGDGGRYVLVAQPPPGQELRIPNAAHLWASRGKTILASQGGNTSPNDDIPRYVKMHQAGLLSIDKIITHTFALEQINEALDLLRFGNPGRIMIRIGNEGTLSVE